MEVVLNLFSLTFILIMGIACFIVFFSIGYGSVMDSKGESSNTKRGKKK